MNIPAVFPLNIALLVLGATLGLSAIVVVLPLRRATRLKAGEALRLL